MTWVIVCLLILFAPLLAVCVVGLVWPIVDMWLDVFKFVRGRR